jgi:hypothetical protein
MDSTLLRHPVLIPPIRTWSRDGIRESPSSVPRASNVGTPDDLDEVTFVDMAYFDEALVEDEDVRCMESYTLGGALPFNHRDGACFRRITMPVDIQAKFYAWNRLEIDGGDAIMQETYHHSKGGTRSPQNGTFPLDDKTRNASQWLRV